MTKQLIITIGREYGSGGHRIAEILAKKFNIPFYDHNILVDAAKDRGLNAEHYEQYDEAPKGGFIQRAVWGYGNSPEVNTANMQFNYMKKLVAEGKSFVIVGRCAEEVLKECENRISIFILGDKDKKIERIKALHNISDEEAENEIIHFDKRRKAYHNYYCKGKWGDSRNYELSVNSSKLGIEKTADIIEEYVKQRMESFKNS